MPLASPATFAGQVSRLDAELKRAGLSFRDMRREQQLELQLGGVGFDRESHGRRRAVSMERLEGPIVALPVRQDAQRASRLRYFLDGSQRTFPAYLIGSVPVIASISAAAILERDERGEGRILPGSLRLRHVWLVPRRLRETAPFLEIVERLGMEVADPLDRLSDEEYFDAAADYDRLVELGHMSSRQARAEIEADLLTSWGAAPERATDDGWILVDGTLSAPMPKALGLVKSFTRQYLTGADAACLFGLPAGYRTTAFRATDGWRQGAVAMWFMRFRDAAGRDARHSLVRVEIAPDQATTERIDELSSWLMAERAPRPTGDARWATLLYPVHFLERILKRYVDADTRGWPGARAGV
jgi:hypothetical protein